MKKHQRDHQGKAIKFIDTPYGKKEVAMINFWFRFKMNTSIAVGLGQIKAVRSVATSSDFELNEKKVAIIKLILSTLKCLKGHMTERIELIDNLK